MTTMHAMYMAFLSCFSLIIEQLHTMLDGAVPRAVVLGLLPPDPRKTCLIQVLNNNVIPPTILSPRSMLATHWSRHKKRPWNAFHRHSDKMPKEMKTTLYKDARYPLLSDHLADGGMPLLLPDCESQYDA